MKPLHGITALALTTALLFSPSLANAQAHGMGEKGQLIVSADRFLPVFNYTYASTTTVQNNIERTDSRSGASISLLLGRNISVEDTTANVPVNVHTIPRVAFDVTVIPQLTLGAAIAFGFGLGGTYEDQNINNNVVTTRSHDAPTVTAFGIVPRVGYILPLGDLFAFWPRGGFGIYSVSSSSETLNPNNTVTTVTASDTIISLDLDPQFALVPLEHFFFHAGPLVNIPLSGSRTLSTRTGGTTVETSSDTSLLNFGLSAGLGGWFNVF